MKIVLDTNIFISAILNQNSKAGTVIQEWKNNSIEIITSKELLEEIKKVLQYPKIKKIIGWNPERIQEYIEYLYFFTTVVDISNIDYYFKHDPNDSHIIATYIAGECDWLITGDKALLSINQEFNIITLEQFILEFCLNEYLK